MRIINVAADSTPSFPKLSLSLAGTPEEIREVQRLRYKVFVEAMGLSSLANTEGLDKDEYDDMASTTNDAVLAYDAVVAVSAFPLIEDEILD